MVIPAWPPMTGTFIVAGSEPMASPTNLLARTTSRVVTPNTLCNKHKQNRIATRPQHQTPLYNKQTARRLPYLRGL